MVPVRHQISIEAHGEHTSFRCADGRTLHVRKATRPEPELARYPLHLLSGMIH
jgi:hypothetical protein